MRKIALVLAILLIAGVAVSYAYTGRPASQAAAAFIPKAAGTLATDAIQVIIPVRYARGASLAEANYTKLSSGDVVIWDTNSADGVTVSASVVDAPTATAFAGVCVTDISTAD